MPAIPYNATSSSLASPSVTSSLSPLLSPKYKNPTISQGEGHQQHYFWRHKTKNKVTRKSRQRYLNCIYKFSIQHNITTCIITNSTTCAKSFVINLSGGDPQILLDNKCLSLIPKARNASNFELLRHLTISVKNLDTSTCRLSKL